MTHLNYLLKRLIFLVALMMVMGDAWGDSSYYASVTVAKSSKSTGSGAVYANTSSTATSGSETAGGSSSSSGGSVSISLFANPNAGSAFLGWSETNGSETIINGSAISPYTANYAAATSTGESSAKTYNRYALFKQYPTATINVGLTTASSGGGTVSVSASNTAGTYGTTASLTQYVESQSGGTKDFYLFAQPNTADHYVFSAWTTDKSATQGTGSQSGYKVSLQTETDYDKDKSYSYYAIFKKLPYFDFNPKAVAQPTEGGSVSATPAQSRIWATDLTQTQATTKATFTATANDTYYFAGWTATSGKTTPDENMYANPYTENMTNSVGNSKAEITRYGIFARCSNPTSITMPATSQIDKGGSFTVTYQILPAQPSTYSYVKFTSDKSGIASVDANTGVVTGVSVGTATITATAYKVDKSTVACSTTMTVKVMDKLPVPLIELEPDASKDYNFANATLTRGVGSPSDAIMKYTLDGTEPSSDNGTTYTNTPVPVENGQTIKARSFHPEWYQSDVVAQMYNKQITSNPTIEISLSNNEYKVSFTCKDDGVAWYYTTDGSTPTYDKSTGAATGTTAKWSGSAFNPGIVEGTIKVIATHAEWRDSEVIERSYVRASGVAGGVVYLNDYEDHNWTYYSGVDSKVDGGNYNTNYNGILYSPDPRNVKITYQGNGGAVSIDNSETSFVYYKTLEKQSGKWLYTTIANPFSKRPVVGTGDSRWRGFGSWEVVSVSGGTIKSSDGGTTYAVGSQIPSEADIQFVPSGTYTKNCTSMEVVLKVNWVQAYRYTSASSSMSGSTYELNFLVATSSISSVSSKNCTVMAVEPDGSADYRSSSSCSGSITVPSGGVTKIEYIKWTTSDAIDAGGKNLYIGQGVTTTNSPNIRGHASSGNDKNQLMKIGSGTYSTFYAISSSGSNVENQHIVLGNDYDRAKGDNSKLTITGECRLLTTSTGSTYRDVSWIESKSGRFTNTNSSAKSSDYTFYMWYASGDGVGYRKLEIQGGEFWHICGGADSDNTTGKITLDYRIKGGIFHGGVFMGAASYATGGHRRMIVTGGNFSGWIAGGSDAFSSGDSQGVVNGKSYIYIGGNAVVNSNNSTTTIDAGLGGNVFGCGIGKKGSTGTQGTVTEGTNVVVADNSYIERGVYGGGSYGYTSATSYLYVTGGHVAGVGGGVDGTSYDSSVTGGLFGGACKNKGGAVNVYMTGGTIEGGLYGGSNSTGNVTSVNMTIAGGQIGTKTNLTAKACGGGYGTSTGVTGNVNMTIGVAGTTTSPYFYGNCYGGSALGTVTGNVTLTINKGAAYCDGNGTGGEIFCGGLGQSGNTSYGNVGGTLTTVINGTDERPGEGKYAFNAVYGGTHYINQSKTPTVTVNGCEVSIKELYGGSKQATLTGTNITVNGGNTIGSLYGGSNMADISGNVTLKVNGGGIDRVFGGNNNSGTIGGTINMSIDQNSSCDMFLGQVYGGGNKAASNAVSINIGCPGYIGQLYGGANEANISGSITLNVHGGKYGAIYGGNNKSGTISGSVTVNVSKNSTCDLEVDTIFGGGNLADLAQSANVVKVNVSGDGTKVGNIYGGGNLAAVYSTTVNVTGGQVSGNIFGGGKGTTGSSKNMILSGGTNVNISGGTLTNVFGGNDAGGTITGTLNTKINKNTSLDITGEVYGGGNEAASASGNLEIGCVDHIGSVYGGAKNADVTGNIALKIKSGRIDNVFGGNNLGGNISGTITIDVQHADCDPIVIGSLYGAGNLADYTAPAATPNFPLINLKTCGKSTVDWSNSGTHCMKIGTVYGGGKGAADNEKGKVIGNPIINANAGEIGTIYGGGNAADVVGNTVVNVIDLATGDNQDIYVTGNVYGGGNQANVTGNTKVQIGPAK